ncbi:MAG: Rieske (2Fe-2S) protein [Candidatus Brockarchaeota archaeon]|nr:Rieske (2Fe-2S) protein [Candidatus Brockarchaeota archaeon]
MGEFVKVGKVDDVPEGGTRAAKMGKEEILLAKVGGKLYACSGRCTHLGLPLAGGKLEGTVLQCPHHRSKFDMADGRVLSPPAKLPLRIYEVKVEGKDILAREASR